MKKTMSKSEAKELVKEFFSDLKNKSPKEVKKIKRLAMQFNIPLKEKKKLFCKKCCSFYNSPKIRIKDGVKKVGCRICGHVSRWRIKLS